MKRATLTAYPTSLGDQPADLTDRLLPAGGSDSASPTAGRQPRARRTSRKIAATAKLPAEPETSLAPPANLAGGSLAAALEAVELATAALDSASHEAPARYEVALRYRLDALAHHLQQVKEFVTRIT